MALPLHVAAMKSRYILAVLSLLFPLSAGANGNYPPQIPGAEVMPFKVIGSVTLNLYVFKPDGWKAADKRSAAVFFFGGGAGITAVPSISCRYAECSAGAAW
ncbi:MAG: hypothetical protein VCA55_12680 [Verrucomicrobiales bacterium]